MSNNEDEEEGEGDGEEEEEGAFDYNPVEEVYI